MIGEYDKDYFEDTAKDVGLVLTARRPLWRRWVKILRKYEASGKLLDVGCGPGFFLEYVERYFTAHGIDISEYAIRQAKQRAHTAKLSIGNAMDLDFKDDYFDVVTCFDLLEHLPDPKLALQEFFRVLKREGILIIRVPNTYSAGARLKKEEWFGHRDETHVSLLSTEQWADLLKENRFEILEVFFDGLWDTPYFKVAPKFLQDIIIKFPSLILFWCGLKFSKKAGENLCVITRKR